MGVLYCFAGGAASRVRIQVNLDFPSRLRHSLHVAAPRQESTPDTRSRQLHKLTMMMMMMMMMMDDDDDDDDG